MRLPVLLVVLSILAIAQAQACQLPALRPPANSLTDEKSGVALTWRFAPAEPKIGEFFAVEFAVCDRAGNVTSDSLRVDAQMPAHRHGMNFQPKITPEVQTYFELKA